MKNLKNPKISKNYILVGLPGSGKSFLGREIAYQEGMGFLDMDELMGEWGEEPHISLQEKVLRFREKEQALWEEVVGIENHVIASGGGAVENSYIFKIMKNLGSIVWLNTPVSLLVKRLQKKGELEKRFLLADIAHRPETEQIPLLKEKLEELLARRVHRYAKAHWTILVDEFVQYQDLVSRWRHVKSFGERGREKGDAYVP